MADWTEEQILDEIIALTEKAEEGIKNERCFAELDALQDISSRLGRLYQEVGKKLL